MGQSRPKDQYELPRDLHRYEDMDEVQLTKAVMKYQSVCLMGRYMEDVNLHSKIIHSGNFRTITLRSVEGTPKKSRKEILRALCSSPACPWTLSEIVAHPQQYLNRVQRLLEITSHPRFADDARLITTIVRSNNIRFLVLKDCGLKGRTLDEVLQCAVNVTSIDLSDNTFKMREARAVRKFIERRRPTEVILRNCELHEEETYEIVSGFGDSQRGIVLYFSGNTIGKGTVKWIEKGISRKKIAQLILENIEVGELEVAESLCSTYCSKLVSPGREKAMVTRTWVTLSIVGSRQMTRNPSNCASSGRRSMPVTAGLEESPREKINHDQEIEQQNEAPSSKPYDMTLRRYQNNIYCILDKNSQATDRYPEISNYPTVFPKMQTEVPEGSYLTATLQCEERQDIILKNLDKFSGKSLQKNSYSIMRFLITDPGNVRSLLFKLEIRDEIGFILPTLFELEWPWPPARGHQSYGNHVNMIATAPVTVTGTEVNAQNVLTDGSRIDIMRNEDVEFNIGTKL